LPPLSAVTKPASTFADALITEQALGVKDLTSTFETRDVGTSIDDFQKFVNNPIERLNRLQSAWKGIADVNIIIPTQAVEDQNRNILLVQIVEEAIANAVRHAGATQVKVTAEMLPDARVRFSVINDGVSSKEESIGLGSVWLDHHAPNSWSREKLANGSELTFTL
jgi:glucose-6-phosphate-specific signal transduction histidine kinase